MESVLETIKKNIEDELKKLEIVVDGVTYEKSGNYYFLRVVLDKVNGIDLDTVVEATHLINPILDRLDLIEEEYILDVSSKERGNE